MAILLDGKQVSRKVLLELTPEIEKINARLHPHTLRLVIVMVGSHPASEVFIKRKKEVGMALGITVDIRRFPEHIATNKLRAEVATIARDKTVRGIVVQLPLPPHIHEQKILDAVPVEKDVDVLGYKAAGKFYVNNREFTILPSTLAGILRLLHEYGLDDFTGKNVVVAGSGKLVGKPAINYFMRKEASASAFNIRSRTTDKAGALKMADIIISGAGSQGLITGEMVTDGVVVVDAGASKDPNTGKLVGDVDFESVEPKASYITPVPGGVGPMTVAMIFYNLVQLTKQRLKIK
ncbi:MAG: bifunctional 5,10-methylenetetrahydrofolate dehydrogenase/5,10-methenyltetrahydrofolate cyclohydrolase [Candidatus Spechtbacteria bacterium]|nr:bifunctional 5,10-methylenetetrahydrofolate dehydrogenase/5,10-methenyltetrahydrofolate cyclohydrolase [Candidatus Spechtbacteria bacterium]